MDEFLLEDKGQGKGLGTKKKMRMRDNDKGGQKGHRQCYMRNNGEYEVDRRSQSQPNSTMC